LRGRKQPARPFQYRESPGYGGQQCVRAGEWKLVRQNLNAARNAPKTPTTELYDLAADPRETADVAAQHPDIVARLSAIARAQPSPTKLWPIRALDGGAANDDGSR